jgi:hypothetical protein
LVQVVLCQNDFSLHGLYQWQNATSRLFTFSTKNCSGFFSKDKKYKRARFTVHSFAIAYTTLFCDYKWVKNIQVCMEKLKVKNGSKN